MSQSRTVYQIHVVDCHVIWQSKLKTATVLSAMEAEYVALLTPMKPFQLRFGNQEVASKMGLELPKHTAMKILFG